MEVYNRVIKFVSKYPNTIAFRLRKHSEIMEKHLNPGEKVLYVFTGQKNPRSISFPNTFVVALTNKRLLFARKRCFFGYFFYSVTPDMFNDLKVSSGLFWGRVMIDTVKEVAFISNVDKNALSEVETSITEYMLREKKKYRSREIEK